ncbi:ribokinase [Actinoplanes sp. NBRC 14428]|uniref:Sugar/nucleoside kinase (Ribokinase family) n=1 Tax=Pseudosporangium ferrugineum TaxID=439699 RepID=A0A2T0SEJ6_9ACTN|nr:carbohydrate kinase family protein [Pseudosporangium ferrugineum]PRY31834.1 sugar/nucleoside kinase (ribokinase family) [Pseudosporangium ferrugineum]BCJ49935.1 ribokinase [Actinoplanes sp. NBRC 14428]
MTGCDVLVLGGVGIDTIVRVPELAVPPGDCLGVPPIRDYVAHSGNGVALGFHALGLRTRFIDVIGDDPQGRQILDRYAGVGLDFLALPAPAGTPRSVNLVDDAGRRFSFFDPRHPPGLRLPERSYLPSLEQARHLHVAGSRGYDAFAHAHRRGITTSTDIHAWDGTGHEVPVREADLLFLSAQTAPERVSDLMRAVLERGRARVVVATEGAAGCRVLTRADGRERRFPAVPPERPVVDSNGAGDAFSTAFMSRWFAGRPIAECVLAGAVSGAFACGAEGTHEQLIGADELERAIARAVAGGLPEGYGDS